MKATVPPLSERQQPGLSETLTRDKCAIICQSCGVPQVERELQRWRECDAWDQPTRTIVVLCDRCAKRLIDPHPRLYRALDLHEPAPGCMLLCVGCAHRSGNDCTHPNLKANGGSGLSLTQAEPVVMHLCVSPRSQSGFHTIYPHPVSACSGREPRPIAARDGEPGVQTDLGLEAATD